MTLSEVVVPVANTKPEMDPDREFGYVDISAIDNSRFEIVDAKRIKGRDAPSRARRPIQPGDVLFSNVRTYLRNIALVPEGSGLDLCSTGFTVLRSNGSIDPAFLFRYVLTDAFLDAVSPQQTGTHYPATSDRVVLEQLVPVPPLAEQKRIVAKVEELLASANAARDRLAHVPTILKRFRQSVLAAASSGALTSDWRNAHATSTAADLVEILRGNCRTEWLEPGFGDRPESDLPQGWSFLALRNLGDWATGGTPSRSRRDFWDRGTVPWISPKDMKRPVLEDSQEHVTPKAISDTRLALLPGGTVLFVVRGMILAHTFPVALTAVPATINQDVRSLIPSSGIEPRYLLLALQREAMWILFAVKEATHGTLRLESETLHRWPIPVPPAPEQVEIVRRVDALFSLSDIIERATSAASARTGRLTQAILEKAFCGELT